MAVVSLTRFASQPGKAGQHLELHLGALQRLRGLGMQAIAVQPVAGNDVGSLTMSVNYADHAGYAESIGKMQADAGWQEFYAGAMASGAAVHVESSIFEDLDPSYQPDPDRPLGALLATQWRAYPGKLEAFVGKVVEAGEHSARLGGRQRALQSVIGLHPMSVLVVEGFADLGAYAAYADKSARDAEWQAFWAAAMSDPTAELIRSGIYVNISGD